jgi:hypothetical protein
MKNLFIIIIVLLLSAPVFGQKVTAKELAERNEQLEYLILDYKQRLIAANEKIGILTQQNEELSLRINQILSKDNKSDDDIETLKEERKTLLWNNDLLQEMTSNAKTIEAKLKAQNQQLKLDNQLLRNSNKLLSEAAVAADTIQKYQERKIAEQAEMLSKMNFNSSAQCARLTGTYKVPFSSSRLKVVLDEGSSPKPSELENMTIEACYQLNSTANQNKIIVYFQLFDKNKQEVVRDIPFSLNKIASESNVNFYEGELTFPTDEGLRLNGESYFYEVKYLENVIASGHLKS